MALLFRITILTALTFLLVSLTADQINSRIDFKHELFVTKNVNGTLVYTQPSLEGLPVDTLAIDTRLDVKFIDECIAKISDEELYVASANVAIHSFQLGDLFFLSYILFHLISCVALIIASIRRGKGLKSLLTFQVFTPIPVLRMTVHIVVTVFRSLFKNANAQAAT